MRRRVFWMFVVCFAAMSCRSTRPPAGPPAPEAALDAEREYEAVTASALVFDPPIIANDEPLELSRAERQPGAVVGYDVGVVERFYIRLDDRQIGNNFHGGGRRGGRGGGSFDRYERRAVTERVGVRYR